MTITNMDLAAGSAGCYENVPPTWSDPINDVHVFIGMLSGGVHGIGFEGSQSLIDWIRDIQALPLFSFTHLKLGPLHHGLYQTAASALPAITSYLSGLGWPDYVIYGHSKGAGEALIAAALLVDLGHPPLRVGAFEAPRVGTRMLRSVLSGVDVVQTATRNVRGVDIVTRSPPWIGFVDARDPIVLTVPNSFDIATKHRIPAVIAAMARQGI